MCNLFSQTKSQDAIRQAAKVMHDRSGNQPMLPGIYPDKPAPIIRQAADGREMVMARWGLPNADKHVASLNYNKGNTNVRNPEFKHWAQWMGVENRCVVPFTRFAEPTKLPTGKFANVWFSLGEDDPLGFFAGAWTNWTGVRMVKEGQVTCDVFAFLTTDANAEVGKYHDKAMPVILRTIEEVDQWLKAPMKEALQLQKPLPNGTLRVIEPEVPCSNVEPSFL